MNTERDTLYSLSPGFELYVRIQAYIFQAPFVSNNGDSECLLNARHSPKWFLCLLHIFLTASLCVFLKFLLQR